MALLILVAVLWIVVLAPGLYRRIGERRGVESIDHFHHQLRLLENSGPKLVAPAYRLQSAQSTTGLAPGESGYPAITSAPGRGNLILLRPTDDHTVTTVDDAEGTHYERVRALEIPEPSMRLMTGPDADSYRHNQARRRRRDTLVILTAVLISSGLLGILPSLRFLWVFAGISAVALLAFVGLMGYAQSLQNSQRSSTRSRQGERKLGSRGGYDQSLTGQDDSARAAAHNGLPGAWDEQFDDEEYEQPRRAAGGH